MAEEKTYVFGEGAGNGILGLLGPMLSQRGVDPNVLLAMQGRNNDGFGEGGWFDHEKGHLAMHISSALKIKPYGEEYQYLTGEIGQSMFKIAKRFLCDDCRQKLVIEIKEIDKKD